MTWEKERFVKINGDVAMISELDATSTTLSQRAVYFFSDVKSTAEL